MKNRRCLVLGSGEVARDKVKVLLQAEAAVVVVGVDFHPDLAQWLTEGKIVHGGDEFQPGQLAGVWLVINTVEDNALRRWVWQETEKRCIFLNTVDVYDCCTAHWPAIVQRPPVTVAIGTGGASPALAGYLRRKIAAVLPDPLMPLAHWLQHWRKWLSLQVPELARRAKIWQFLTKEGLVELFLAGRKEEAEKMILQAMEKKEDV